MIVVKIELWPFGDESRKRLIAEGRIANDGTGDHNRGNYNVELMHAGSYAGRKGMWRRGRVMNHLRKLSPYHLVERALVSALGHKPD